jgi:hypothetical protein
MSRRVSKVAAISGSQYTSKSCVSGSSSLRMRVPRIRESRRLFYMLRRPVHTTGGQICCSVLFTASPLELAGLLDSPK